VTFVLPHLVRIALHCPTTTCKLVWMIRDIGKSLAPYECGFSDANRPDACVIIQEELEMLEQQLQLQERTTNQHIRRAPLLIEIHITGGLSHRREVNSTDLEVRPLLRISCEMPGRLEEERKLEWSGRNGTSDTKRSILESSPWFEISLKHGRASTVIEQHFPTNELSPTQSLTVMSCGPAALCDEVRMQVKETSSSESSTSVDYVEECFSW
jgi:hypothetical protein